MAVTETLGVKRPTVYVHLYYGKDAETYRDRYLLGFEPDESPYGFHLARNAGVNLVFSRDSPPTHFARRVRRIMDFDLFHAWSNRHRVNEADIVWTMTEGEAFAVSALMALGVVASKPIISNAVWLLNRWSTLNVVHRAIYRYLSRNISVMTVHSARCVPVARSAMPKLRVQLMHFGVNSDLLSSVKGRLNCGDPINIFSAGNDKTRDWVTLISAFGGDPRFHLKIVCGWLGRDDIAGLDNVELVRDPTRHEFVDLYREADFVIIPMFENIYSGITVALEASAASRPIVSTSTGGVPTYFDETEVIYVPAGDPDAMREAVLAAVRGGVGALVMNARARFDDSNYSTEGLIDRYIEITKEFLSVG